MNIARLPWIALLALGGQALAQEPAPAPQPEKPKVIDPLSPIQGADQDGLGGQAGDAQAEIIRLFHEVEKTLESIDVELADAGAGQAPLGEGKESGIDKLLQSTGEKSDQAVAGIDKILELAQQLSGQSGGT